MAIIPIGQQFHTLSSTVNTVERGSAQLNSQRQTFTMQDIANTVLPWPYQYDADLNTLLLGVNPGTTGADNTALGVGAGDALTDGNRNTLLGYQAGYNLKGGDNNIAIGYRALYTEDYHGGNIAIGAYALEMQNQSSVNAYNIAIGHQAGETLTQGISNILIGFQAGEDMTTESGNIAIGWSALAFSAGSNTGHNTAVGYSALHAFVGSNGAQGLNVAVGNQAGLKVTTGEKNTILGSFIYGTPGSYDDFTADKNVLIGYNAGEHITDGGNNVIIGAEAGDSLTSGQDSTIIGQAAGDALTTQDNNTLVGMGAGFVLTGESNTFIGRRAGYNATTGDSNICIGTVDLSTATVSDEVNLGTSAVVARFQGAATGWSFVSDARDKKEIKDLELGVDFVNKLKPRNFKWDLRNSDVDKGKEASGFVAQEIQEVLDETNTNYTGIVDTNDSNQYTVAQTNIIPILVKAVQELSAKVEVLENKTCECCNKSIIK